MINSIDMNKIKEIYSSKIIKRRPPVNLAAKDSLLFGGPEHIAHISSSYLRQFENIWLSSEGILIKNFRPIKENIICYEEDFSRYKNRYIISRFINFKKRKFPNNGKKYL